MEGEEGGGVEERVGGGGVMEGEVGGDNEEQDSVDCLLLSSEDDLNFANSGEAVKEEVVREETTIERAQETAVVEEDAVDSSISLKEEMAEKGEKSSSDRNESVSDEGLKGKVKEGGVVRSVVKKEVTSVGVSDDLVVRAEVIEEVKVSRDLITEQQNVKSIMAENTNLREAFSKKCGLNMSFFPNSL